MGVAYKTNISGRTKIDFIFSVSPNSYSDILKDDRQGKTLDSKEKNTKKNRNGNSDQTSINRRRHSSYKDIYDLIGGELPTVVLHRH